MCVGIQGLEGVYKLTCPMVCNLNLDDIAFLYREKVAFQSIVITTCQLPHPELKYVRVYTGIMFYFQKFCGYLNFQLL
mgnify:CR=1 FL=1